MTFADNLVRLRREKGFSQEQLADLMDVSRQAVSKWEAGQTMPDLPKLVARWCGQRPWWKRSPAVRCRW